MAEHVTREALSVLDERLKRVEFLVRGDTSEDHSDTATTSADAQHLGETASTRIHALERTLHALAARSPAVADILQLQRQQPQLFQSATHGQGTLPDKIALAQILLAHEPLYRKTTTQLIQLRDAGSVPDSTPLAHLAGLQPRISQLQAKQEALVREYGDLRTRSATALERWYETGVLEMGERWADWEERLRDCEILVRRKEAAKKREEETG